MLKFLLFAVVVVWLFYSPAVRNLMRTLKSGDSPAAPQAPDGRRAHKPASPQEMVACAHCGLHLPRDEATLDGDHAFCGEAHRRAGVRRA